MQIEKLIILRQQIDNLHAERLAIQRQVCSREQVDAMLKSWLASAEQEGKAALQLAVDRARAGQAFAPYYVHGNAAVSQSPGAAALSLALGPLLLAVAGRPAIEKSLAALVKDLPEGLSPRAKKKRLDEISAELDLIEADEEQMIVELEQEGEIIFRRPDARPEIVLA